MHKLLKGVKVVMGAHQEEINRPDKKNSPILLLPINQSYRNPVKPKINWVVVPEAKDTRKMRRTRERLSSRV